MTAKKAPAPKAVEVTAAGNDVNRVRENPSVARLLLDVRADLRNTKLWKEFEIKRTFEAFSVHILANEIEPVLNARSLISSFRVTKWDKVDNRTVIEGMLTYEHVDTGEVREYPGVGEAMDNGDKGIHKATSDARKSAVINSLNLGIGFDKESEDPRGDTSKPMNGAPKQAAGAPGPAAAKPNGNGGTTDYSVQSYTLQQQGLQGRAVLGRDLTQACFTILTNMPTVSSLEAWATLNDDMLGQFTAQMPAQAEALRKIFDARVKTLTEKGCL